MKHLIAMMALLPCVAYAQQGNSFELMSDKEICEQFGDRCPQQVVYNQPPAYPSFYGSRTPAQQYVAPVPAGGFSRSWSRNTQLVQAYDPACNCVVLIGIPK